MIGEAGRHSASMSRASGFRALRLGAATLALYVAAVAGAVSALLTLGGPVFLTVVLLAAAALAFGGARTVQARTASANLQADRQLRGALAERVVADELVKARPALVINGAEINAGGDADHVVAHLRSSSRGVLAVIETKAGGGQVRMIGRALLTGKHGRAIPGDPIRQVGRQAAALRRITGRSVAAVVCVPQMTNAPFMVDNVMVCGTKHLAQLIRRELPDIPLTADDVAALAQRVHPKK